jgi:anti-sigma B factor antagonist
MEMTTTETDGVLVVRPAGPRLDASASVAFRNGLIAAGSEAGQYVLIDLGAIEFVDSSGLGALVNAVKQLKRDRQTGLCCLQRPVEKLLRLTRMDRVLMIFDETPAGVAGLRALG